MEKYTKTAKIKVFWTHSLTRLSKTDILTVRVVRIYSKSARQKDADGDSNLSIKQDSEPQRMRGGYCGQKMNITPELPTEMIDCLLMTEC